MNKTQEKKLGELVDQAIDDIEASIYISMALEYVTLAAMRLGEPTPGGQIVRRNNLIQNVQKVRSSLITMTGSGNAAASDAANRLMDIKQMLRK